MSIAYNTWPVVLIPYNLPPLMCMKQQFFMLSLLIPGPTAPRNDIDVYLQPLIYELQELWEHDAFKVSRKSNNDASLKRHGIDCHCKYLDTLTLVTSVIILNKNIDTRKKRHNLFNLIYLL